MPRSQFEEQWFEERRAITRRRRARILLPIATVMVMLAALIGIALYDYKAMRADTLSLSRGVINSLQSRIETEVESYLLPIPGIIRLTRDLVVEALSRDERGAGTLDVFGIGILRNAPQLTALFVGNTDGEFAMVRRYQDGDRHGVEIKRIMLPASGAGDYRMTLTRHDADGHLVSSEEVPWDGYDPRTRPWFVGANQRRDLHWTDVYPFFTGRAAGVTASVPAISDSDAARLVIGADVTLDSISRFLRSLSIGKTGLAIVVDSQARLIAHPNAELVRANSDGSIRLARVHDLGNPVINRAFDRYRVEGHGRRDFELNGRRYISSASSLNHLLKRDWSILVVVPEEDFVGFVVENVGKTLGMGLSVIALAAVLAGLLIHQGLRADRDALRILDRRGQLDAQSEALMRLTAVGAQALGSGNAQALAGLTESVAQAADVRRVSIWQLDSGGKSLFCADCFDRDSDGHTQGTRLPRDEHAALFAPLEAAQIIRVADVAEVPSLASLHMHYLTPTGCRALLVTPVTRGSEPGAWLWFEDDSGLDHWPDDTVRFAQAVANLLSPPWPGVGVATAPSPPPGPATTIPSPVKRPSRDGAGVRRLADQRLDTGLIARRAERLAARLGARADDGDRPNAELIDHLAVMSLRLTNAIALAEPGDTGSGDTTVACLLRELQSLAGRLGIDYLKFMNDQLVASVEPGSGQDEGVQRIVEFAMCTEELCERLLAPHQASSAFRIGIDFGPAIGGVVGTEPPAFLLWGEAVQMAATMADTALPGSIQVTESVYQRMNAHFMFQPRGHHYLEGIGEFSTYLLGGRL